MVPESGGLTASPLLRRQCSECDQASSDEADIAMETLPDGTKRSRRQIKGPIKFIPQEMSPEPKKHQVRLTGVLYTHAMYKACPGLLLVTGIFPRVILTHESNCSVTVETPAMQQTTFHCHGLQTEMYKKRIQQGLFG